MPRQPMPDRAASATSSTGALSVNTRYPKSPTDARMRVASRCSLRAEHLVVVAAERVARDECLRRIAEHRVARACRRRAVVHARGDDADRPGHEFRGSRAGRAVPCHIIHRAVPSLAEPVEQPSLLGREIGAGDADLLEAQRLAPAANVGGERVPMRSAPRAGLSLANADGAVIRRSLHHRFAGARDPDVQSQPSPSRRCRHRSGRRATCDAPARRDGDHAVRRPRGGQDDAGAGMPACAGLGGAGQEPELHAG